MVLRLRLNERAELTVVEGWGSVEAFEKYLNMHASWTFLQKEKRHVNGKWITYPASVILLCDKTKLVLSPPIIVHDGRQMFYYFRILTVRTPNREDRVDALSGRQVDEPIEVEENVPDLQLRPPTPIIAPTQQEPATVKSMITTVLREQAPTAKKEETEPATPAKPTIPLQADDDRQRFIITPKCPRCETNLVPGRGMFCQNCAFKLPPEIAVHPELIVAITAENYGKLATYLKQKVNVAWKQLVRGRRIKKVSSMGQNIFLLVVDDEMKTSTLVQEEKLDELLTETNIGRVTSDIYEIHEVHRMMDSEQNKLGC